MARRLAQTGLVACVVLAATVAAAQSPTPPSGARRHDGFYLRTSLGPAYVRSAWKSEDSFRGQPQDAQVSGAGVELSLLAGGTPIPGFAIGGGLTFSHFPGLSVGGGHVIEKPTSLSTAHLGLFADGFLAPDSGWHAGGSVGLATYDICCPNTADHEYASSSSRGFGGAVWMGYDAWVSDEWSVGWLARASGLSSHGENYRGNPSSATTYVVSGLFTILYH